MKRFLTLALCTLLMSCTGEENIYREYECYFLFDTFLHPLPCQLTATLGNNGQYVKIETRVEQGGRHLTTTRNYDNATEDIRITTDRESRLNYALGANNCILVGVSSYDNILVAYEGQCSNCLKELGGRRYPMVWQNNGTQLYCDKCKRSYDVNNGVVANGSPGIELYRYKAALDGGILRVWN